MKIRDRSTLDLFDDARIDSRIPLRVWVDPDDPNGDNFAGGGGAKLGIEQAYAELGLERRATDVAVNHWAEALAMYRANHPRCRVYCEDVRLVDPVKASGGRRYALAWFSPTCIFFSQARGGELDPEEATSVRGLANVAVVWARSEARPRVTCLENVKQFEQWGPLHRQHSNGCSEERAIENGAVSKKRKAIVPKCLKGCCYGRPIKARLGEYFRQFVADLRQCYRYVEWRVLKAHHFGAPTSRERFFLIASDRPVVWPVATHGPGRIAYRTAADCIDFTIECPSIFERAKALADKTLARVRAGIERFVFGAARPFIVPTSYGNKGSANDNRAHSIDEPAKTIAGNRSSMNVVSPVVVRTAHGDVDTTGKRRGKGSHSTEQPLGTIMASGTDFAIATPFLVHRSNGERAATETTKAQAPRVYDIQKPIGTLMAQGEKFGLTMPVLVKNYSEREGGFAGGQPVDKPAGTITQRDHHSLAALSLIKLRGTDAEHVAASPGSITDPLDTISASGTHHAMTAAYLVRFNGTSTGQEVSQPLSTIDTRDRFALVTLTMERDVCAKALRVAKFLGYDAPIVLEIDGEQWILVDIGFRMLTARELFRCQGFPDSYVIEVDFEGKTLTKTAQIKCCGNSVPPQLARAVAIAAIQTIRYEPGYRRAA